MPIAASNSPTIPRLPATPAAMRCGTRPIAVVQRGDRHPQVGLQKRRALEAGRGDADDGEAMAVERDGLADERRIATESALPQLVAHDRDGLARRQAVAEVVR